MDCCRNAQVGLSQRLSCNWMIAEGWDLLDCASFNRVYRHSPHVLYGMVSVYLFVLRLHRLQEVRGRDRPQRVLAQAQGDRGAGRTAPHPRHQRRRQAQR